MKNTYPPAKLSAEAMRYYRRIGLFDINHDRDTLWIEAATALLAAGVHVDVLVQYKELLNRGAHTLLERRAILNNEYDQIEWRLNTMQTARDQLAAYLQSEGTI